MGSLLAVNQGVESQGRETQHNEAAGQCGLQICRAEIDQRTDDTAADEHQRIADRSSSAGQARKTNRS